MVSTTSLGDTILATPAVAAARRAWPQAEIFALIHRRWTSLLEFCPHLDGLIAYPGKFRAVFRLLKKLKRLDLDLALILQGNDPDIVPLIYLSGARYLVYRDSTKFSFLLDKALPLQDPERKVQERLVDVVRSVAGPLESGGLELCLSDNQRAWADDFWLQAGIGLEEKVIVLNPGGSRQPKQWPEEHWRDLIRKLVHRAGLRLVLMGAPAERPLMESLAAEAGGSKVIVAAKPAIMESAVLLERASAFIGPDSGLAHVAVSLGKPVAVMFGPDNPTFTGPHNNRAPAVVLQADPSVCPDIAACHKKECRPNKCLEAITPDMVIEALTGPLKFPLAPEGKIR